MRADPSGTENPNCNFDVLYLQNNNIYISQKLTGDVLYTQTHLSDLLSTGARFARQNFPLWHVGDGITGPPNEILDRVCPGDCNNQGNCVAGNIIFLVKIINVR